MQLHLIQIEMKYIIVSNILIKPIHFIFAQSAIIKRAQGLFTYNKKCHSKWWIARNNKKLIHWDCNVKGDLHLDLKEELNQISYPKTPKEKLDNLINHFYKLQSYDGEQINIMSIDKEWSACYFKNKNEFNLYIETIIENDFMTFYNDDGFLNLLGLIIKV